MTAETRKAIAIVLYVISMVLMICCMVWLIVHGAADLEIWGRTAVDLITTAVLAITSFFPQWSGNWSYDWKWKQWKRVSPYGNDFRGRRFIPSALLALWLAVVLTSANFLDTDLSSSFWESALGLAVLISPLVIALNIWTVLKIAKDNKAS